MRAFRASGLVFLALFGLCGQAAGQAGDVPPPPRVLLLQAEGLPARPGLEPSLRIQLRGTAEVVAATAPFPADLPSRLGVASAQAEQQHAEWVVWIDPVAESASEPDQVVMYLVGRRDGRALIEVVRVPAGEGPEVDRSLALKVHELIDANDGAAYALGNAEVPEPQPAAPAQAPPRVAVEPRQPPAAASSRVQLWIEGGAQLALEGDAGAVLDGQLAIGPSLTLRSLIIALPIELAIGVPRNVEQGDDEARWSELGVTLWAKLGAQLGRVALGGSLGGKLVFTEVDATASTGQTGHANDLLPAVLASVDAEMALVESLGARVSLGTELRLKRRQLVLLGEDIGNTGRIVPFARLSLVWHAL